jgi:uncharacterized caspase-like protein
MALAVAFVLWAGLSPALAERRVALVIGNSDYLDVPVLENPRNDAEDVAAALKRLGFETVVSLDADRDGMQKAIDDFSAQVEGADVALFYYAGHAMQHQGVNYLIPIDGNLSNAAGLRRMTRLNDIVSDVKRAKALRIMVIDACRDNPLADKLEGGTQVAGASRSVGLAKLARTMAKTAPQSAEPVNRGGDIIVYAAEAGHTAADGVGRNSPFSAAFVKYVETEGQEVVSLMRRITTAVQDDTNGAQRPELSLAVPFEFYFKPGSPAPPPTVLQLVPGAKPHEVGAIESAIDGIMRTVVAKDRDQARREVMVLLSDIASGSGLKPDQIAQELPQSYAKLVQMRESIALARETMESEPEVGPFIEIAAAAVASGRRPDRDAAEKALAQARARFQEARRLRNLRNEQMNERAAANIAMIAEQQGNIAQTGARLKEAAEFFLAAARETPKSDHDAAIRRYWMATGLYASHGTTFLANDALREAIRINQEEALPRVAMITPADDDTKRELGATKGLLLAEMADAQTRLGGRTVGYEGAKMMVEARQTYKAALDSFEAEKFTRLFMNILDRRAARDMEFGRRMIQDRGRSNFDAAVNARRIIWKIQARDDDYKADRFKARNNLADALYETARRTDGVEGDKLIEEAIGLLQDALESFDTDADETLRNIVRANLAQALGYRAERKPGLTGQADIDRAVDLFAEIDKTLERDKDPRLWVIVRQFQAEFLRMVGERTADRDEAFAKMKAAFEMYQSLFAIISRETAPNDWAIVCAEMGYTYVAAIPIVDAATRKQFAEDALKFFNAAGVYFKAGGFQQDLQKMGEAQRVAQLALGLPATPAEPQKK